MNKLIANITIAIIAILGLSIVGYAQTESNKFIKSSINTTYPGKCLDVFNGNTNVGTPIVQFRCHGHTNQRFTIERLIFTSQHILKSKLHSNRCIGITNDLLAKSGESLRLVPCYVNGRIPFGVRFYRDNLNGKTRFRAVLPARLVYFSSTPNQTCIDIPWGLNQDRLRMQLYYCHNGGNQQWHIL